MDHTPVTRTAFSVQPLHYPILLVRNGHYYWQAEM